MSDSSSTPDLTDEVTEDGVFLAVRDGYQAVYEALPGGDTFNRIWRETAYRGEFPVEFAHIGFLTLTEARRALELLGLTSNSAIADVACGSGGPGLWVAQQSGARLIGIDPADSGLVIARRRAQDTGLGEKATFQRGTFEHTGLDGGVADAGMTIEAFQYAPDKRAALREFARILKPGSRLAIVCFEVDPAAAAGVPVLGVDPVADYAPLLTESGFIIDTYEETPGWAERVYPTFTALVEASDALTAEMGEQAATSTLAEAMLTVALQPYPRRVLIVATLAS